MLCIGKIENKTIKYYEFIKAFEGRLNKIYSDTIESYCNANALFKTGDIEIGGIENKNIIKLLEYLFQKSKPNDLKNYIAEPHEFITSGILTNCIDLIKILFSKFGKAIKNLKSLKFQEVEYQGFFQSALESKDLDYFKQVIDILKIDIVNIRLPYSKLCGGNFNTVNTSQDGRFRTIFLNSLREN